MDRLGKLILVTLAGLLLVTTVSAKKMPAGAYITSAKIEVLSGDKERYQTAVDYLDSLFKYYGPHAEGLFWMNQIYVDLIENTGDIGEKREYVVRMVAYTDSLHMTCANKDINKKFRKKCDEFTEKADSTLVEYWRTFYNSGVEQVTAIPQVFEELGNETDSIARDYFQQRLDALIDTCLFNMTMAIMIDSTKEDPFVGIASVHEAQEDFATATKFLERALEKTDDRVELLLNLAYNYIRQDEYCKAIPYFREFVDVTEVADTNRALVISTMYNLTICYNNCKEYEEAKNIFHRMLELEPENTQAMTGIGRFHNEMARFASDSAAHYRDMEEEEAANTWKAVQDQHFDSSQTYLKRVFELKPNDTAAAEEYGIICYIRGEFEAAATAFKRISELAPDNADNWISLGDCNLSLQQFEDATFAYENAIELQPGNRQILERLVDLYQQLQEPEKRRQTAEKLQDLK